jgi:ATP-dependent metalloprotease FtsH
MKFFLIISLLFSLVYPLTSFSPFLPILFKSNTCKKNLLYLNMINEPRRTYRLSQSYHELLLKRLNSKNNTIQSDSILGLEERENVSSTTTTTRNYSKSKKYFPKIIIQIPPNSMNPNSFYDPLGLNLKNDNEGNQEEREEDNDNNENPFLQQNSRSSRFESESQYTKSKNFEIYKNSTTSFKDVGGYENVKNELRQCVDLLKNFKKYRKYNVRIPKGLILEGPPGTGKTLIAKALAGEANCSFIPVSGSDFQEKYVGIGPTRIKELFRLAKENIPCIIFVDEMDALGRKRSSDGEGSSSERDNTLNALLVELDGFKNTSGIFLVAATNRIDLLDNALTRPGRIDKKIHIGVPDNFTRNEIINIHIKGKPHDNSIILQDIVELTDGLTGAQIENLLNEAMLNALRENRKSFNYLDFDLIMNKMIAGWQPIDHQFSKNIIDHIAIHEMGHAITGILSKHHSKMSKVVINLSSPKSPGYTIFEKSSSNIYTREALFEHLMILLAGRIAEEVVYGVSVTTGAINDFEEALKLAEKMILYYGMGKNIIYPNNSEKYKEMIDTEVIQLINDAYKLSFMIIQHSKDLILETSEILKKDKILKAETLHKIITEKYNYILEENK